jgi:hypothetical protein
MERKGRMKKLPCAQTLGGSGADWKQRLQRDIDRLKMFTLPET